VARSIFDNKVFFETDVLGTQTLCNAVVKNNGRVKKLIHISTSEVYGNAVNGAMTEDHPLLPCSPYASAKAGADRLVYSYWKTYGVPAIIVRPFNNYGPHQHLEKVVPRFITSALLNEPLTIHGDGTASRDWVYVTDHCRALDMILHTKNEKLLGKAVNIGTGVDVNIKTLAKMVLDKLNRSEELITYIHNRPGQVERHIACIKRAKQHLEWMPETDIADGIDRTIEWYASNRHWWEPLRWMRQIPIKLKDGTTVLH
jgi:dTDP-glucose 4,6-dehydratase